jgi:hypothetical protein
MTRGETRSILCSTTRRGLIAAIAALTIAFWVGASWSTAASRQSASWVSGPGAESPYDPAAATAGSDTATE